MQGPFDFALLGANKQVLRKRLPRLRSSDLAIQFAMPENAPAAEEENAAESAITEAAAAAAPQAEKQPVVAASSATTTTTEESPVSSDIEP